MLPLDGSTARLSSPKSELAEVRSALREARALKRPPLWRNVQDKAAVRLRRTPHSARSCCSSAVVALSSGSLPGRKQDDPFLWGVFLPKSGEGSGSES